MAERQCAAREATAYWGAAVLGGIESVAAAVSVSFSALEFRENALRMQSATLTRAINGVRH